MHISPRPHEYQSPRNPAHGTPSQPATPVSPPQYTPRVVIPTPPDILPTPTPTPTPPTPEPVSPPPKVTKPRRGLRRLVPFLKVVSAATAFAMIFMSIAIYIGAHRLQTENPDDTAFMNLNGGAVIQQFVSIDHISRHMIASAIAHEDAEFIGRSGPVRVSTFIDRVNAHMSNQDDPSGSTIPQQLAKNLWLTPDQSAIRKGLELVLATGLTMNLSDARIMELYLNYAQFGPGMFGICAASWYYFNTPPSSMYPKQAAQMAGILPLPSQIERAPGGGILLDDNAVPLAKYSVERAGNYHVENVIASLGGWEEMMKGIGLIDSASDHAGEQGPDSCSVMPQAVADRLESEGAWWSGEYGG